MAKLTEEEHHARAMLMNLVYLPWANAYVGDLLMRGLRDDTPPNPWLDADTMEPLDMDEVSHRIEASIDEDPFRETGLPWVLGPNWGTRT